MNDSTALAFEDPGLHAQLEQPGLDADLPGSGVVGFGAAGAVTVCNRVESKLAGLSPARVLGHGLSTVAAPCMNDDPVAQRFAAPAAAGTALDVAIDDVFTLRMKPEKVRLRLLATPDRSRRSALVERRLA